MLAQYNGESCTYEDVSKETVCVIELEMKERPEDKFLENTLIFECLNGISLTKREREILRLIVSGKTNRQIAQHLSRSERTVEFHRNRLMRKIGAHNAAELVKAAIAMGLI